MEITLPVATAIFTGVATYYLKFHGHIESRRKSARDSFQRLFDLTADKLDEVPAIALQIAVHDAFGRSIDEAWIRLIWKQKNPLPLLHDCARTSHLLKLSDDGSRIEDRTVWKGGQYRRWSWLAIVLGSLFFIYTAFLSAIEFDHNPWRSGLLVVVGISTMFLLFLLASMFDAADRVVRRFSTEPQVAHQLLAE